MAFYFMESYAPLRTSFLHSACKGTLPDPQRHGFPSVAPLLCSVLPLPTFLGSHLGFGDITQKPADVSITSVE